MCILLLSYPHPLTNINCRYRVGKSPLVFANMLPFYRKAKNPQKISISPYSNKINILSSNKKISSKWEGFLSITINCFYIITAMMRFNVTYVFKGYTNFIQHWFNAFFNGLTPTDLRKIYAIFTKFQQDFHLIFTQLSDYGHG